MGGGDPGEICEEDGVHDRAVQQLLHQQHHCQWDRYTGERGEREREREEPLLATVTIKTAGRSFYVRIYLFL